MELHVCSLLGVLALTTAISAAYAGWQVWTTTETKRMLREEPAGTGLAVRLSAARNEWEGFQILMRSDEPVKDVRVEVSDLKGPSGATIGIDHVRIYRQHQFHLTQGTYRNERFRPGWYPDPLIPLKHPLTRQPLSGGRFTAVPFDLPADETHGFWVDIYVPPDAPAGEYQGVYRVSGKGQGSVEMPVTLTVWDFTLPRTFTLQTALGSPADRMRGYHRERANAGKEKEPSDWEAVEAQCAALLSEHHINATPPRRLLTPRAQPDGTFRFDLLPPLEPGHVIEVSGYGRSDSAVVTGELADIVIDEPLCHGSTVISGTAQPGRSVTIVITDTTGYLYQDGTIVGSDGHFLLPLPTDQPLQTGQTVQVSGYGKSDAATVQGCTCLLYTSPSPRD